ncbi:MAG: transposase [Porphyromonas sp.]|nr:transposase [Porphyromonas sp.]
MDTSCYNNRKSPRASFHDYKDGIYFITICTKDKQHYFGKVQDGVMHLSPIGEFCQQQWEKVPEHYPYATVPLFVVMPNHIHAIVSINQETEPEVQKTDRKTLAIVVGGVKGAVSSFAQKHKIEFGWQSRYYDRIIRNRKEGNNIAHYIENNVARWDSDEYYSKMP